MKERNVITFLFFGLGKAVVGVGNTCLTTLAYGFKLLLQTGVEATLTTRIFHLNLDRSKSIYNANDKANR